MKIVFALDSFKGTISSRRAAALGAKAAHEALGECQCLELAVADGGEGTLDAVAGSAGGQLIEEYVHGPLGEPLKASWGLLPGGRALIEMASASGLTLVPPARRDPRHTSSFGSGELVLAALEKGCRDITVAIGGSATNDGGMGFARALGVRFLDAGGRELKGVGDSLPAVARIDTSALDPRLSEASLTVMCDVDNPLCGKDGATYTFGPQKGADEAALAELEEGMCHYRDVIKSQFGRDPDAIPGAGAAGGLGAALMIFFGARRRAGIDAVLDLIGFDELVRDAGLVVTGEGRADAQSVHGKAVSGIGRRCAKYGVPAVALVGSALPGAEALLKCGIKEIIETSPKGASWEEIQKNAEAWFHAAALSYFRRTTFYT